MEYCAPNRVPHWHFLGGPDVWTDHDRAAALAWTLQHRRTCSQCGTDPDDWDLERGGRLRPFEPKRVHCHGCQSLQEFQDEQQRLKVKPRPGESIALVPVLDDDEG